MEYVKVFKRVALDSFNKIISNKPKIVISKSYDQLFDGKYLKLKVLKVGGHLQRRITSHVK